MSASQDQIEKWFTYRKPADWMVPKFQEMREAAKTLAEVYDRILPDGADKTKTLRELQMVSLWANSTLIHNGDDEEPTK